MRRQMLLFFILLSGILALALGFTFFGKYTGYWQALPSFMWPTSIFLLLLTTGVHAVSLYLTKSHPQHFVQFFLLIMVVKLFIYLVYNFAMILIDTSGALPNVILFFSVYISFTLVETVLIFKKVNENQTLGAANKNF